ncbi:uncharacterized protein LOC132295647 [Cornus florida]|uniref:uncharacterized protein LOC132295647 n=1 Tax=Cornus florida TaxID=4283 RepID=UPI00289D8E71|nr:uncharacterized protein LOC132295647 [Cornus florida]
MAESFAVDIHNMEEDDWRISIELYKKSVEDGLLLKCLSKNEAISVMAKSHGGTCGAHQAGIKMRWLLRRYGYHWLGMLRDCMDYAKGCIACQKHGPIQWVPAKEMQFFVKPWPFRGWAMDLIGMINPPSFEGHHWIIVATDYFTKWVELVAYKSVDQATVIDFIKKHIFHRFGILESITTDNATVFRGNEVLAFGEGVQMLTSTPYYAQGNGQAESSNKILIGIIEKMIDEKPRIWHETLSEALWADRNSKRASTEITPYKLTYGHDAVLPMEMDVRSARLAFQNDLIPADYDEAMLAELEDLDEVRLHALDHIIAHKKKVMKAYNKRVRPKTFAKDDLVWKVKLPIEKNDPKYGK